MPINDENNDTFEAAWKRAAARKPTAPSEQDAKVVSDALDRVELARLDLAAIYAKAEGGTTVELAVGNALVKLRAAAKEIRKALGDVAQMRLDLNKPAA